MDNNYNKNAFNDDNEGVKPIPVMDFDISTPIDVKRGTETLCGNPAMFYMMLSKFEDMTFMNLMGACADAVDANDMKGLMDNAHQLKSPAGYIGGSHVHYACYFI